MRRNRRNRRKQRPIYPIILIIIAIALVATGFIYLAKRNQQNVQSAQLSTQRVEVLISPESKTLTYNKGKDNLECDTQNAKVLINSVPNTKINNHIAKLNNEFFQQVSSYEDTSEEDNGSALEQSYDAWRMLDIKRADSSVVSILFTDSSFTGGAYPNSYRLAYNYNTQTGDVLSLNDITSDKDNFVEHIRSYIKQDIISNNKFEGYYENWEQNLFETIADHTWYLSNDGLVIIFNQDILGPHALGIVEFTVPYSVLGEYIEESYLPKALNTPVTDSDKILSINLFEEENSNQSKLTRIAIDENGRTVQLKTNSEIYNIELVNVVYTDEGEFIETTQWYVSNKMTPNDTLVISTYIPELAPNLKIKYTLSDGTKQSRYISESGMDGSLLLIQIN